MEINSEKAFSFVADFSFSRTKKFKFVEELYNRNYESRSFLDTLFVTSHNYDGIYLTFHDINSKENIVSSDPHGLDNRFPTHIHITL